MMPRRRRAAIALGVLVVVAGAGALVLDALRGNVVFFFTPTQVADKAVPAGHKFRVGGLVEQGSLGREGLQVNFIITDTVHRLPVRYRGALPDLFKEGKGVVAQGKLGGDGVFDALEVLAKHDENYMPPDAAQALKLAKDGMKGPQP